MAWLYHAIKTCDSIGALYETVVSHAPGIVVNFVAQELGQGMPVCIPRSYKHGEYSRCVDNALMILPLFHDAYIFQEM